MTGFAADTVIYLKALAPLLHRYVIDVAVETKFFGVGRFNSQVTGDALGRIVEQHRVSLRVLVFPMPNNKFVLLNSGIFERCSRPMTSIAGTGHDAKMHVNGFLWFNQNLCTDIRKKDRDLPELQVLRQDKAPV